MAHGGMENGSKHEANAYLFNAPLHAVWGNVHLDPACLQDVGAAADAGCAAVAVFGHLGACRRRHDGRRRGNVHCVLAVATGACRIYKVLSRDVCVHLKRVFTHCLGHAGDLGHGLTLDAQRRHESADLGGRGLAFHDLIHHVGGALLRKILAFN